MTSSQWISIELKRREASIDERAKLGYRGSMILDRCEATERAELQLILSVYG